MDTELKTKSEFEIFESKIENPRATKGKRFANYIIDLIVCTILGALFGAVLGVVLVLTNANVDSFFDNKFFNYALGVLINIIYFTIIEASSGRSIGKLITKTKVVNEDGSKMDFKTSLIRSLCRNIPFNAFSFLNEEASGWHDKFSKTKVVEI